uniref:Uncharacterized protein n=1 Tax=Hucho hucho TaxID=62062 RepID=A0A4W5N5G0_9TELE
TGAAAGPGGLGTARSHQARSYRIIDHFGNMKERTMALITTLINHKDKPKKLEQTQQAIQRVGQAVSAAVGRFVAVGEAIAMENEELKEEMGMACFEARRAGDAIAQLTDVGTAVAPPVDGRTTVFSDRTGMVKAARMLLSSVTKVLVLADRIVIKQIITSRNKHWQLHPPSSLSDPI